MIFYIFKLSFYVPYSFKVSIGMQVIKHAHGYSDEEGRKRRLCGLTRRSDSGVLSPSGRCCSRARTMQLAMMVARIIHSNGVRMAQVKEHFSIGVATGWRRDGVEPLRLTLNLERL